MTAPALRPPPATHRRGRVVPTGLATVVALVGVAAILGAGILAPRWQLPLIAFGGALVGAGCWWIGQVEAAVRVDRVEGTGQRIVEALGVEGTATRGELDQLHQAVTDLAVQVRELATPPPPPSGSPTGWVPAVVPPTAPVHHVPAATDAPVQRAHGMGATLVGDGRRWPPRPTPAAPPTGFRLRDAGDTGDLFHAAPTPAPAESEPGPLDDGWTFTPSNGGSTP